MMIDVVVIGGVFREVLDADTASPQPRLGGSGLTAALVSSRLGARTALVSYVGAEDADAASVLLGGAGVDGSCLATLPGVSGTFLFPAGDARPWPMYRPAEATPSAVPGLPDALVYLLFGIPDFDPVDAGWLGQVAQGSTLIWDRQGWLSRTRDSRRVAKLSSRRKVYLANEDEALSEFGVATVDHLARTLPPAGFLSAVVKRGSEGCVVISPEEFAGMARVPGFEVDTQNTIGSGDAFAGALSAELAVGSTLRQAVVMANAVASTFLRCGGDPLAAGLPELSRALMAGG